MFNPPNLAFKPVPFTERLTAFSSDSYPSPQNCLSKFGESLLAPLNFCGHDWQILQSEQAQGTLQTILHVAEKAILMVGIAFAIIPGVIGSLMKCLSNPPLEQDGCFSKWELRMSKSQEDKCRQIGLYDFNNPESKIASEMINFSKVLPEYPKASSVYVSKQGHKGYFSYNITLFMGEFGVSRPNSNEFIRNLVNSFRPPKLPSIELKQIKVLQDLLLGIKSGTEEDYQLIKEHFACSTRIDFRIDLSPELDTNVVRRFLEHRFDLKISY